MPEPTVWLEDVNLSFSTSSEVVKALDGVSLQLHGSEFVAVLGASGSGKTSLLNVIAGLQESQSGRVHVAGRLVSSLGEADRARMRLTDVGVVFQDHNLIPEFTAEENVLLPLRARGLPMPEAKDQAAQWLETVGIGELGRRMPAQLSGGQRQRVGIARGLVGGRKILVADEPTGSLDAQNSSAIFALLHSLSASGVTVVVATHDHEVEALADRVLTMRDGRIISDTNPEVPN